MCYYGTVFKNNEHMEEIVLALRANNVEVTYSKLNSEYGHDAFLIENGQMNYIIRSVNFAASDFSQTMKII